MLGVAAGLMMLGGGAMQAAGALQQGKAASASARFNMQVAEQQNRLAQQDILREASRIRAQNRVTAAKSGVRMTGSPLEVAAYNAVQTAEIMRRQTHSTNIELALLRSRAQSAVAASRISAGAAILGASGQAAVTQGTL